MRPPAVETRFRPNLSAQILETNLSTNRFGDTSRNISSGGDIKTSPNSAAQNDKLKLVKVAASLFLEDVKKNWSVTTRKIKRLFKKREEGDSEVVHIDDENERT